MTRNPFGRPHPDQTGAILVGKGSNTVLRAEVNIVRRGDHTEFRIRPGGLLGQFILNTFGLAAGRAKRRLQYQRVVEVATVCAGVSFARSKCAVPTARVVENARKHRGESTRGIQHKSMTVR